MILFLHNRYRTTGGEERVVDDLLWLVREHLGEEAQLIGRDSAVLGRARAATALLAGGLQPGDVAAAVRRTRARLVHAHNLLPSFGWRGPAAAREAGARVVLHLHNYRLVCAVGTCFNSRGEDCTRCQGRDTLPGVRLNCRGTGAEAAVYAAALALWQRRMAANADAVVVPSRFALARLQALRAPLDPRRAHVLGHLVRVAADRSRADVGRHALVVSRLAPEKGVADAVAACARAGLPLVVAGDGPERPRLERMAAQTGADVRLAGRVGDAELAALRADAAVALVPSRAAETFGLAAAEAMAAGLPVAATAAGAVAELVDADGLVPVGDVAALASAARARWGDAGAGDAGLARIRAVASPEVVSTRLAAVYAAAAGEAPGPDRSAVRP
ncbi:MAG TPA: glycosyltransferase [Solirubrobacteraceae bacterium]|nr:glycosyltransferase [Solirubrobacteraceae bacterium]